MVDIDGQISLRWVDEVIAWEVETGQEWFNSCQGQWMVANGWLLIIDLDDHQYDVHPQTGSSFCWQNIMLRDEMYHLYNGAHTIGYNSCNRNGHKTAQPRNGRQR